MEEEIVNKSKFSFSEFIKRNKIKLFLIISLIVASIILFISYNEYQTRKNATISEKYNRAKILIENKNNKKAKKILEEIVFARNSFYSPSALNLIVDNNLIKDKVKMTSYFDQIIFKSKLEEETKNLFIFKKIIFIGDDIEENDLLSNLNPIIQSDSLWKNTVTDYIIKYYLSKGEFNKARDFEIFKK